MMRYSTIQVMKKIASENFKLKDVKFENFEKIDIEEDRQLSDDEEEDFGADIEVWANCRASYEGTPPDSYRVLNSMLMDWVDDNESKLKKEINPELISFLKAQYPNIDTTDLNQDFDDYIWEDQVDYMPEIDEDKKEITFTIELVLEIE